MVYRMSRRLNSLDLVLSWRSTTGSMGRHICLPTVYPNGLRSSIGFVGIFSFQHQEATRKVTTFDFYNDTDPWAHAFSSYGCIDVSNRQFGRSLFRLLCGFL